MMLDAQKMSIGGTAPKRLNFGAWAILLVLLALLATTIFVAYMGWRLGDDADVPTTGYVAMAMA